MHKITKGLKKKKKGKKSKHKEEELFKPEELEAYRREHQGTSEASGQNEEWKKFLALTSGVDDILKKTQGDLDRIKSTSFFQRIPLASETKKQEEEQKIVEQREQQQELERELANEVNLGIVQVSESESEEEEDDDIFDTAYIDAIATGEVKLAYIPESPTEQPDGDDPFDTSIAERAILGPAVERKGIKLVPIGAAVEVLTGRVHLPTCATQRPASSRRQVLKERDLLLGSFDDNANSIPVAVNASPQEVTRTLLDDDSIPLSDEPIDLSKTLHQIPPASVVTRRKNSEEENRHILQQFDVINKIEEDDADKEFEALAAESLSKTPQVVTSLPLTATVVENKEISWNAFGEQERKVKEVDPFDTTFAENILPGKAELRIIENEILNQDIDFDPRAEEPISSRVSINITYPSGQKESVAYADRVSEEELNIIKPIHRDLLGGSNTDLSKLNDHPLQPSDNRIEFCDAFETTFEEIIQPRERTVSRPDVLNICANKTVSFDLPKTEKDLLGLGDDHKNTKPLTPFYVRKNSVPESHLPEVIEDPFDTSFVSEIAPGKAELKLIENELFDPNVERNLNFTDQDFDPRDEKKVALAKVVHAIKEISNPITVKLPTKQPEPIDLLAVENDIEVKVLTPAAEQFQPNFDNILYRDPFDTSIACNILPGKTELKLLETELISSPPDNFEDSDFDPRAGSVSEQKHVVGDLLVHSGDTIIHKPLTPLTGASIQLETPEDIDPFDTSIANNIQPGKAELKLLESEFIIK